MPYKFSFLLVYFSLHNVKRRANIKQAYIPAQQAYIAAQQAYIPAQQAYIPAQQAYIPEQQAYIPAQQAYIPAQFTGHLYNNISIGVGWGCIPVPLL